MEMRGLGGAGNQRFKLEVRMPLGSSHTAPGNCGFFLLAEGTPVKKAQFNYHQGEPTLFLRNTAARTGSVLFTVPSWRPPRSSSSSLGTRKSGLLSLQPSAAQVCEQGRGYVMLLTPGTGQPSAAQPLEGQGQPVHNKCFCKNKSLF